MRVTRDTRTTRHFIPILPFLFLGIVFGGHGPLPILLSLLASVALTAGISFLLLRRRARSDSPLAGAFVAPATSAGLEGVLQLDTVGLHWMPRRARLPMWFIPWGDVVGTSVRAAGETLELHVQLASGDTMTLIVDAPAVELERALARATSDSPR
jgi:hypothetical protein